ncbi:hypothetical protein EMCRGX_G002445 [Ephydatia muelleri]|eukprot:Em0001g2261a
MKIFFFVALIGLLTFTAEAKPMAETIDEAEHEVEAAQHYGRCGKDAGGMSCPYGSCCSRFGYCFIGDPWCGAGCQPQFGKCLDRCGAGFGNRCPVGYCCSQYGWCGYDTAWCGAGCQHGYGRCDKKRLLKMDEDSEMTGGDIEEVMQPGQYHQKLEDAVALEAMNEAFELSPVRN